MNADTRAYLNWYRRLTFAIPRMSDKECRRCGQERDAGNAEIHAKRLAAHHLFLIYLAYHRVNAGKEVLQDMFQLGYLRLVRCGISWRHDGPAQFRTYASKSLIKYLPRALQTANRLAVGSVRSRANVALIEKISLHYRARGTELPEREVAELAGCSQKLLRAALNAERSSSLEAPRRYRGSTRLEGMLANEEGDRTAPSYLSGLEDRESPSPEEATLHDELVELMQAYIIRELSDRQKFVLVARFNLENEHPEELTLDETGRLIHLSRERTRQIEREALEKLREYLLPIVNPPTIDEE